MAGRGYAAYGGEERMLQKPRMEATCCRLCRIFRLACARACVQAVAGRIAMAVCCINERRTDICCGAAAKVMERMSGMTKWNEAEDSEGEM